MTPFPRDPADRKAAHEAMKAAAPELMSDIAALRGLFPGARLTHFSAGPVEYGAAPRTDGVPVTDEMLERVLVAQQRAANKTDPERLLAAKAAKKQHDRIKRLALKKP